MQDSTYTNATDTPYRFIPPMISGLSLLFINEVCTTKNTRNEIIIRR